MKKTVKNILTTIGFIVVFVGWIIDGMKVMLSTTDYSSGIFAVLSIAFIFTDKKILQNIGYGFSALLGAYGIIWLIYEVNVVTSIGAIVMAVSAILYMFEIILAFFGFIKTEYADKQPTNYDNIVEYSELLKAGIITEEEFNKVKAEALNKKDSKGGSIDELKKWKKLVDQKIVSEEEYKVVKDKILKK